MNSDPGEQVTLLLPLFRVAGSEHFTSTAFPNRTGNSVSVTIPVHSGFNTVHESEKKTL